MRFSAEWLRAYVKLPEKAEAIARLLTEHSFETTPLAEGKGDLLDSDVLPNRAADCLSHLGVARELGAILSRKVSWPALALPRVGGPAPRSPKGSVGRPPFTVRIENPRLAPRFIAAVVEGLPRGASSPPWLQRRLRAVGVRPQHLVVDVTNYVLWEVGQPTHAFDARAIGKRLGVRAVKAGGSERLRTLDGVERSLPEGTLVLTSDDQPIDVAGILGGAASSVRADTTAIVLTSCLFDRVAIRKASRALSLRTEASDRFSKGRTAAHAAAGAARVMRLLAELAGARVTALVDAYPRPLRARPIPVAAAEVSALLGLRIPGSRQQKLLRSLGFGVQGTSGRYRVTPPPFRTDLAIPEDVAEELGRLVGLAKIPTRLPTVPLRLAVLPDDVKRMRTVQETLKGAGWSETYTPSFSMEEETLALALNKLEHLQVVNPLNRDQIRLRLSLLPNLLHQAWAAVKTEPVTRLYEIGRTYPLRGPEVLRASGLLVRRAGGGDHSPADFYDVKGVVEQLLASLGLMDIWFDDFAPSPEDTFLYLWQPGRSAEVKVGEGAEVGLVGALTPEVLDRLGVRGQVTAFDLDLSEIFGLEAAERTYKPPLPYPPVYRDLSLLVPETVRVDAIEQAIERAGAPLVQDVDVVDLYEGAELPEGRRSVTLRITYGSPKRTLTDREVTALHEKITATLETELGVEAR